jgi:hypothetical protein
MQGFEPPGSVEHLGVDPDHVAFSTPELGSMEVRQHPAFGSQPVPQMLGLCFGSNELRQRRRVEVPDVQLALPLSHLRPFRRHLLGLEAGPLEFGIHQSDLHVAIPETEESSLPPS